MDNFDDIDDIEKRKEIDSLNAYEHLVGLHSYALLSASDDNFNIVFQDKNEALTEEELKAYDGHEICIPLVLFKKIDSIHNAYPNCYIFYNKIFNIESILTGYVLGKIFRHEDTDKLYEVLRANIFKIFENTELLSEIEPLIEEGLESSNDDEFSDIEDEIFVILDHFFKDNFNI